VNLDAEFAGDHVRLSEYALAPADSALRSAIPATAIRDVDPTAAPPEIRTVSGETVFVSAMQSSELVLFCIANRITMRRRPDVWGDLLEPFLDTEFTPERRADAQARLDQVGLGEEEVARIRAAVDPLMYAYNGRHWDWCHLGLADLLEAAVSDWIPEEQQLKPADRAGFYSWAMRIANLG
jgi:hypothetical protein